MNHPPAKLSRYGDELQCARCGRCWPVDDPDPPACSSGPETIRRILEDLERCEPTPARK